MDQQVVEKKPPDSEPPAPLARARDTALRAKETALKARDNARDRARVHIELLAKMPLWAFILAVGGWTVLFKTLLVPVVGFLNSIVFEPLGLTEIYTFRPLLDLADALTKSLYDVPYFGWSSLATLSQLLFVALLFPIVATYVAQVIPQHELARKVPSERRRAVIAVAAMGLLYLLAYGEVALFISGGVVAIPLVYTFFHRLRVASPVNAYLITCGVHVVANATIVVFRGIFGGV